jgi:hypothetical protein
MAQGHVGSVPGTRRFFNETNIIDLGTLRCYIGCQIKQMYRGFILILARTYRMGFATGIEPVLHKSQRVVGTRGLVPRAFNVGKPYLIVRSHASCQ